MPADVHFMTNSTKQCRGVRLHQHDTIYEGYDRMIHRLLKLCQKWREEGGFPQFFLLENRS